VAVGVLAGATAADPEQATLRATTAKYVAALLSKTIVFTPIPRRLPCSSSSLQI
jgi:hypothetical protein